MSNSSSPIQVDSTARLLGRDSGSGVSEQLGICSSHRAGMFSEKELQPAEGAAACPESVGQRLVLCVSDDGVGLPPDLDVRRASSLGLKLVDGLSKQLEGELTIQRLAAGGAAFRIVFSGYAGGENP